MTDLRDLDAACARGLGWTQQGEYGMWHGADGVVLTLPYLPIGAKWDFTTDPAATRLLLDAVQERGKTQVYLDILIDEYAPIVKWEQWECWDNENYTALWALFTAPPEAHARAFVQMMEGQGG